MISWWDERTQGVRPPESFSCSKGEPFWTSQRFTYCLDGETRTWWSRNGRNQLKKGFACRIQIMLRDALHALSNRLTLRALRVLKNPAPRQPSRISPEYLLITPRSVLWWKVQLVLKHNLLPLSYTSLPIDFHQWQCIGYLLECHTFSRLPHSSGKLLHTSYRFPTSMATALISIHGHSLCVYSQ